MRLRQLYTLFKREAEVYKLVLSDKRTPWLGKFFLWLALGYLFFPFDFIPDFIPILGQLDELIVIPLLIFLALKFIPKEITTDNRNKLNEKSPS